MRFGTVAILNPASGRGMTRQSLARLIRWLKDILFLPEEKLAIVAAHALDRVAAIYRAAAFGELPCLIFRAVG